MLFSAHWFSWLGAIARHFPGRHLRFAHSLFFNRAILVKGLLSILLGISLLLVMGTPVALAGLNDDRYDGNIFPLYAGNGYLVPPKLTLAESLKGTTPTLLFLYIDDSSDCKTYAPTISQLDAFYGRAADLIPINVDSIRSKSSYEPTEPGYYYKGLVPQTVIFDQSGKIVLNESGVVPFERIDDVMRQLFDLLPRSESVELKRRQVNEINTELVPQEQQ